jgi:hypothetical protein
VPPTRETSVSALPATAPAPSLIEPSSESFVSATDFIRLATSAF